MPVNAISLNRTAARVTTGIAAIAAILLLALMTWELILPADTYLPATQAEANPIEKKPESM